MPTYKRIMSFGPDKGEVIATIPFAGRAELLAYANRLREAGGANALDALLPSQEGNSSKCLIARALNFGCEVCDWDGQYADGSYRWIMKTPDDATARRLAKAVGARLVYEYGDGTGPLVVLLPKRIGNAAEAFDAGHPEFDGLSESR